MARRIALVVPAFPKLSETFIVSKFLGLLEHGWDVHVVCHQSAEGEWGMFPQLSRHAGIRNRVHVTWAAEPRWMAGLKLPLALLRCAVASPRRTARYLFRGWRRHGMGVLRRFYLDAELVRLGCDLVHFEFGALAANQMDLGDLLGARIVVSFRGYDLNYVGLERPDYYASVWKHADAIHLLGEDLWRRAQKRGCPPEKRHVLVPPAIDAAFFGIEPERDSEEAGRPCRVLSVGRLEWKKGHEFALAAVRKLLDRGVPCEYRIVGDGDYLGAVAFARHQLGLEAVVTLLGALSPGEVRQEMARADVFLHAAVSEGFCNAVMEAQAMMLPVVCTDADGLRENVEDGVTGFVVPRRNADALAQELSILAADPALRRRMGQAGRRRVASRFPLEAQIRAFESLYRSTLDGGSAPETEAICEVASGTPV